MSPSQAILTTYMYEMATYTEIDNPYNFLFICPVTLEELVLIYNSLAAINLD